MLGSVFHALLLRRKILGNLVSLAGSSFSAYHVLYLDCMVGSLGIPSSSAESPLDPIHNCSPTHQHRESPMANSTARILWHSELCGSPMQFISCLPQTLSALQVRAGCITILLTGHARNLEVAQGPFPPSVFPPNCWEFHSLRFLLLPVSTAPQPHH